MVVVAKFVNISIFFTALLVKVKFHRSTAACSLCRAQNGAAEEGPAWKRASRPLRGRQVGKHQRSRYMRFNMDINARVNMINK